MKKLTTALCLVVAAASALSAADQSASGDKTTGTRTQSTRPSIPPVTIPKDAVRNPDGTFAWTDKDGARWIFRQTPFGVSKSPAGQKSEAPPAKERSSAQFQATTTAREAGGIVHFAKMTPFGTTRWERKKSDLSDDERQILAQQNAKAANPKPVNGKASAAKPQ